MTENSTATVRSAREHARAQEGAVVAGQPTIPASAARDLPPGVEPAVVAWDETLAAGAYAARAVRRGSRIRFTDLDGDTNLNLVIHHAARPAERLNVADTMKLQWNAYPTAGGLLLSDMGRVLATLLEVDGTALDLLCGAATPALVRARHGASGSDSATPGGRDRLLLGLAKHGLSRRDLPQAANLFTGVRVAPGGGLRTVSDASRPGGHITLRAELDLLVTAAVTPHPLDDRDTYTVGPVRITAWEGAPAGPDDPARLTGPEARRAFENTDDVLPAVPGLPTGPATLSGRLP